MVLGFMGIMERKNGNYLYLYIYIYMGGCQNCGPFLDPYYNTAPDIQDSGFGVSVAFGPREPGGSSRVGSKSRDLTQCFVVVLASKSLNPKP